MNVVSITQKNREAFDFLIPEGYEILGRNQHAFGVTDDFEGQNCAVGILHFYLESGSSGGEDMNLAVIDWLFVDPRFHRKKVATLLVDELLHTIHEVNAGETGEGISGMICDLPDAGEYHALGAFYKNYGFEENAVGLPDAFFSLEELITNLKSDRGVVNSKNIKPLAEIDPLLLTLYLSKMENAGELHRALSIDLLDYEGQISMVSIGGEELDGVILVQKTGIAGILEPVYLSGKTKELCNDLTLSSVKAGSKIYAPDTEVKIQGLTESTVTIVNYLFPNGTQNSVRRYAYDILRAEEVEVS